jgi:hypothetical protein
MRKDFIAPGAIEKAYQLFEFSERGFHGTGVDADDVPVLAPEVSKLKKSDPEWQPESAFYGNKPRGSGPTVLSYTEESGTPEYNSLDNQLAILMDSSENLGGRLRRARQLGNFQEEHRIVAQRNDVMKAISAVRAKMMVNDLGRAQRDMNNGMMYDSQNQQNFSEMIDESDSKIARLEAALLEFSERKYKSAGGDSNSDPGQNNTSDDEEEADDEADEEEIGAA